MKDKNITQGDFRFIFRFRETWLACLVAALIGGVIGYLV